MVDENLRVVTTWHVSRKPDTNSMTTSELNKSVKQYKNIKTQVNSSANDEEEDVLINYKTDSDCYRVNKFIKVKPDKMSSFG